MAFFVGGSVGRCEYYYHRGDPSDETWGSYLALAEAHARARKTTHAFTIASGMRGPSASQRKHLADMVTRNHGLGHLTRHAFLTDSKLIFGINTAVNWLTRKAFDEKCFMDPAAAMAWLEFSSDALENVRSCVPPEHQWLLLFQHLSGVKSGA